MIIAPLHLSFADSTSSRTNTIVSPIITNEFKIQTAKEGYRKPIHK